LFAAIFIATGELEIFGTIFRNWYWLPVAPWTHIPSGNPPSVIAGGYCVIDASVLLAMRGVLAVRSRLGAARQPEYPVNAPLPDPPPAQRGEGGLTVLLEDPELVPR
jgi:hypothetical protein